MLIARPAFHRPRGSNCARFGATQFSANGNPPRPSYNHPESGNPEFAVRDGNQERDVTPPPMSIEREPNSSAPAMPLSAPPVTSFVGEVEASGPEGAPSPIREFLRTRGSGGFADQTFAVLMLLCALSIFAIVLFILFILIDRSKLSLSHFGFSFFLRSAWDPVAGDFGALPFIFGTVWLPRCWRWPWRCRWRWVWRFSSASCARRNCALQSLL